MCVFQRITWKIHSFNKSTATDRTFHLVKFFGMLYVCELTTLNVSLNDHFPGSVASWLLSASCLYRTSASEKSETLGLCDTDFLQDRCFHPINAIRALKESQKVLSSTRKNSPTCFVLSLSHNLTLLAERVFYAGYTLPAFWFAVSKCRFNDAYLHSQK